MSADPEAAVLRLAARQHNAFARGQALALGMSSKTIRLRLRQKRWRRLHQGVYAPASAPDCWQQTVMAACLACGKEAFASHRSAAGVWGLISETGPAEVTVPIYVARSHPGIIVHRSREAEAVRHDGFRVATPMRTLLDLAAVSSEDVLEAALDSAHRSGFIEVRRLTDYLALDRNLSRPGSGVLRELVAVRDPRSRIGSDLETAFLRVLRRAGLPVPLAQRRVRTRKQDRFVDFAYPEQRIAIELDGFETHGTRTAFESDRARQNELEELGWHVLRFTFRQVMTQPVEVAITVGMALGLMPVRWRPNQGRNRSTLAG